ncbi:MAG: undecaprenyl diphosphate synthase family protein, partial [Bacteroidota bacterium]
MPRVLGHRAGVLRVEECVRTAPDLGVTALTLFAFSTENWQRPAREVNALFSLLKFYFTKKAHELAAEGVRVRFIGRRDGLNPSVARTMT